jgi:c-di-GMP-specific phosphodiesterase
MMASERWIWDATATLEALGAAEVALWHWEPERDRLRLNGASRALGLGPLAPECSSAALRAFALPQDRALAEDLLRVQEPGCEVAVRMRMRGGGLCIWRGIWLEEGVRAAGVVAPETKFAASETDRLTGLPIVAASSCGPASACSRLAAMSSWSPTWIGCAA